MLPSKMCHNKRSGPPVSPKNQATSNNFDVLGDLPKESIDPVQEPAMERHLTSYSKHPNEEIWKGKDESTLDVHVVQSNPQ